MILNLLLTSLSYAAIFFSADSNNLSIQKQGVPLKKVEFQMSPEVIANLKELNFILENGVQITARLNRLEQNGNFTIWLGKANNDPISRIIFAWDKRKPNMLAADIFTGGKSYTLAYFDEYGSVLFPSKTIEENDLALPPIISTQSHFAEVTEKSSDNFIDVMMVYTDAVLAQNANIEALIQARFTAVNQMLEDSCVQFRYRMVHLVEVTYAETGNFSTDLGCIYSWVDGCLDNLHTLRDTYGADLVQMVIYQNSACGLAYSAQANYFNDIRAFSVVALLCDAATMAHEFAHNLGVQHDRYEEDLEPTEVNNDFEDGYGFVDLQNLRRDIMSYNTQCAAEGVVCTRVGEFSSPKIINQGVPFGRAGFSDSVAFMNRYFGYVANYRSSVTSHTPNISSACLASGEEKDIHCFIATAALGTYMHQDVIFLREFRDNVLNNTALGRSVIQSYYQISPYLAHHVTQSPYLKTVSQYLILSIVFILKHWLMLMLLSLSLFLTFRFRSKWLTGALILLTLQYPSESFADTITPALFINNNSTSSASRLYFTPGLQVGLGYEIYESKTNSTPSTTEDGNTLSTLLAYNQNFYYLHLQPHHVSKVDLKEGSTSTVEVETTTSRLDVGYKMQTIDLGLKYLDLEKTESNVTTYETNIIGISANARSNNFYLGAGADLISEEGQGLAETKKLALFAGLGLGFGTSFIEYYLYRSPEVIETDNYGTSIFAEEFKHHFIYAYGGNLRFVDRLQISYIIVDTKAAQTYTAKKKEQIYRIDIGQNFSPSLDFHQWYEQGKDDQVIETSYTAFGFSIAWKF